jgi:predicted DCC family thiol-disulfide oxidoreductase YuxK
MSIAQTRQEEPVLTVIAKGKPVMLFDGVCHLCSGSVRFAIARDPAANLRFAPIQSRHGQDFLRRRGLPLDDFETFYLTMVACSKSRPVSCGWSAICAGRGRF